VLTRVVIALVEYLTSEEAGEPLGKSFAWPVGQIVNCHAGVKTNGDTLKVNGNGAIYTAGNGNGNGKKAL
jgi:dihydroceramidase